MENDAKHKRLMMENAKRRKEQEKKLKEQEESKKKEADDILNQRKESKKQAYVKYLHNNSNQILQNFQNENHNK